MYKLVKQREKKSKDLIQLKCNKDENQKLFFLEKNIQNRWVCYFDKLFNEVSKNTIDLKNLNIVNNNKIFHFTVALVKKKLRRLKRKTRVESL